MDIKQKNLPKSRFSFVISFDSKEVNEYYEHAAVHLAAGEKVPGFREGKAPAKLVRDKLSEDKLREEAYSLAVESAWRTIIKDLKQMPIQDPEVEVGDFSENSEAKITLSFDVRPEIKVKDYSSIKIKAEKEIKIEEKEVDEVIDSLRRGAASFVVKLEPAKTDDKVEVSFEGFVSGVKNDKLTANKFGLVLGQGSVIPGFSEQLIGLKKNDKKEFEIKFPKDHFDQELAGKPVKFYVTIDEVFTVNLPELNKEFAAKFGKSSAEELHSSIKEDLVTRKKNELLISQKAKWLSEFEKKIQVDLPVSLVNAEVDRSEQAWREFLGERQFNPEEWLKSRGTTLEKMREDWVKAAEATVTVGLGIAEIAKEQNKKLETNEDFQKFVDGMVEKATK